MLILIRTMECGALTRDFARQLEKSSGQNVVFIVDERKGLVDTSPFEKISLNRSTCQKCGLYTPHDFAWRCGDYGFYLARLKFPDISMFWMIEYDVRIIGDANAFFEIAAARPDIDLLVSLLCQATQGWWWYPAAAATDVLPYRCFFPVVRLTARGVDCLLAKRRAQSRQIRRKLLWPNDECFVATTIMNSSLKASDINQLGTDFYNEESFSFENIIDGDSLPSVQSSARLLHPVLSGRDLTRKLERLAYQKNRRVPFKERLSRKLAQKINILAKW